MIYPNLDKNLKVSPYNLPIDIYSEVLIPKTHLHTRISATLNSGNSYCNHTYHNN